MIVSLLERIGKTEIVKLWQIMRQRLWKWSLSVAAFQETIIIIIIIMYSSWFVENEFDPETENSFTHHPNPQLYYTK